MLKRSDFHDYQELALKHLLRKDYPKAGEFMEMGLGKTAVALTYADILLMAGKANRVLVIGPKRVAESVWSQEALKWEHLKHLKFSKILGDPQQRIAGAKAKADIYLINRENVNWLVGFLGGAWWWDLVIVDESSSFKNPDSWRFKDLRTKLGQIKYTVILTGSPAGNGLIDLWSQIYLLDQGQRLETTLGGYRGRYFAPDKMNGHITLSYRIRKDSEEAIYEKIGDVVMSMKNRDYLDLPERIDIEVPVNFDKALQKRYDDFERDLVMNISEQEDITAFNAGALTIKLRQFANGAIYDADGKTHHVHDLKLDALEEVIDSAGGKPVLVFYSFKSDIERIKKKFGSRVRMFNRPEDVVEWNEGKIQIGLMHPMSAYGLNMQDGSNIICWFGHTWSLEERDQADARLLRQGQKQKVYFYKIVAQKSIDLDILIANERKADGQNALMEAVKARIEKYTTTKLIV